MSFCAAKFQYEYRGTLFGKVLDTGANAVSPATNAGLRNTVVNKMNFVDGGPFGAVVGKFRMLNTPTHVSILTKLDDEMAIMCALQYLDKENPDRARNWPSIISENSPVAYIRFINVRDKDEEMKRFNLLTAAGVEEIIKQKTTAESRADLYSYKLLQPLEDEMLMKSLVAFGAQVAVANRGVVVNMDEFFIHGFWATCAHVAAIYRLRCGRH